MSTSEEAPLETKIDRLIQQIGDLEHILLAERDPSIRHCLSAEELAQRWGLGTESVRRLIRTRQLKPLRGFRPFRITLDEIKRYEALEEGREARDLLQGSVRRGGLR